MQPFSKDSPPRVLITSGEPMRGGSFVVLHEAAEESEARTAGHVILEGSPSIPASNLSKFIVHGFSNLDRF
jgi:hypothetical protein